MLTEYMYIVLKVFETGVQCGQLISSSYHPSDAWQSVPLEPTAGGNGILEVGREVHSLRVTVDRVLPRDCCL